MRPLTLALTVVIASQLVNGIWDPTFRSSQCYQHGLDNLDDRMPLNIGNLIALIEKVERQHTYTNPDRVAEALIHRYRLDGITYWSQLTAGHWGANELQEVEKQYIVNLVTQAQEIVPKDSYEPREECSLHFMLSHSTDMYPHSGMDTPWEEGNYRRRRSASIRVGLPSGLNPATHPIENGVIYTRFGPVTAGTLLNGIMVNDQNENSIRVLLGDADTDYMPDEMRSKTLSPIHVATLSGDIGQSAVIGAISSITNNGNFLGPKGMFGNSTAAPKIFTLENNNGGVAAYLTRAEVFAGIDAMLIQKVLRSSSSSSRIQLSDLLRMYYGDHGLPGYPHYRACNRMEAFKDLDITKIQDQTLNFMFIYAHKFPELKRLITEKQEDYPDIERSFQNALNKAWNEFTSFVGNYNYEDYEPCSTQYSKDYVPCENTADLLMVYSGEGGVTEMEKQRKYLTHLTQMLGVGVQRSRVGVMNGKNGQWIFPMTNFSNVADWGSNFTTETISYGGSSSDMNAVLTELSSFYNSTYTTLKSDLTNASAHSQVVLWNVPGSMPDTEVFLEDLRLFNLSYPDVYFLLVGKSRGNFDEMMEDPTNDFFQNTEPDPEVFAEKLAKRICQVPSVFTFPACDTNNFTDYGELSHVYEGYISPNFTTYVKIAPQNFRFSGHLKLKISDGNVKVCSSRLSPLVDSSAQDYMCVDSTGDLEYKHLCGRWLDQCSPIYLSVTGTSDNNIICEDVNCQYPNQQTYQMKHEGMTCGGQGVAASILLVASMVLTHVLRQ
ncbi:hypothetical protein Pcinc_038873 [Petrolisthes cinctipes]|uniref:Uncharacterized protein n=1 Tax=Petrolisthes cinctipes TaxID=88211 RepID=A0AAE1BPN0_PETCI|nr:hypothetical protein Pcinc_038873 [Petrolisthes cinctipes]